MAEETEKEKTVDQQPVEDSPQVIDPVPVEENDPTVAAEPEEEVQAQNSQEGSVQTMEAEPIEAPAITIELPTEEEVKATVVEEQKKKTKKKPPKQKSNRFKIDRLQISSDLDGVILASFTRRFIAFSIDICVLLGILSAWWVAIIVLIVMKLLNKDLKKSFRKANTSIGLQVRSLDQKLQNYEVEEELRAQFKKHLSIYLKILIYLPIALTALTLVGIFTGFFTQEESGSLLAQLLSVLNTTLSPLNFLVGGVLTVLYFGIMNYYYQGKTVGKKICGIRVVRLNGKKMTFRGSIERATGYTASGSLFLYGFLQFFWDPNRQTTHDKITETIVIRD